MLVDDYGRDLAGTQALQRKQEAVEKDMTALFQQIQVVVVYCRISSCCLHLESDKPLGLMSVCLSVCLSVSLSHKLHTQSGGSANMVSIYLSPAVQVPVQSLTLIQFLRCLQCFDAVGWASGRASGL